MRIRAESCIFTIVHRIALPQNHFGTLKHYPSTKSLPLSHPDRLSITRDTMILNVINRVCDGKTVRTIILLLLTYIGLNWRLRNTESCSSAPSEKYDHDTLHGKLKSLVVFKGVAILNSLFRLPGIRMCICFQTSDFAADSRTSEK